MAFTAQLGLRISQLGQILLETEVVVDRSLTGAITLPMLSTAGALETAPIGFVGDVTLPMLTAEGAIEWAGKEFFGDITLPLLTAEGVLQNEVAYYSAHGDVTIPMLEVDGILSSPREFDGSITLPMLTVEGALALRDFALVGDVVLPMLSVDGVISRPRSFVGDIVLPQIRVEGRFRYGKYITGSIVLPMLEVRGWIRWNAKVYVYAGEIRAGSSVVFCFVGPPNRVVEWEITTGGGAIFPYVDYTDKWGRASALYQSGGYSGQLVIEARYGA